MEYYDRLADGYSDLKLPANAGQQYLSPQSPSPCVKLAARLKPWQKNTVRPKIAFKCYSFTNTKHRSDDRNIYPYLL